MANDFRTSRRGTLAGLGALPLAACADTLQTVVPPQVDAPAPPSMSLNQLAQRGNRRFGSAIAWSGNDTDAGSIQNSAYTALVRQDCGLVVPENELKWQATRPRPDSYDFTAMDDIVSWAASNGQDVRGHVLLWHRPEWFPDWLNTYDFGANPRAEAERLLTDHIRTVTRRYRGTITDYDVVNEAIDHTTNAPIQTSLSRAMGSAEAAIDLAFAVARDELPDGRLVYNDYMSWEPDHAAHCDDVLRLLEGMRKRGTPCDVLGIQSHIEMFTLDRDTGLGPYDEKRWRAFLDEVVGMGYRLIITEFDVKDNALPANIALRDQRVADYTRRYFDLMFDYSDHLDDILVWGMVDKYSWLQSFRPRDDGMEVRSSPYDNQYRAKPMRDAIAGVLAAQT